MSSGSVSDCITIIQLVWVVIFPVLLEDGFNEARCEIPSVEPWHAGAFKSYHPAPLCFSFVL